MKEYFRDVKFHASSEKVIAQCETIITEYAALDLRLTLRQLYYQLVSRDFLPNEQKAYKRLSQILSDARLAGVIDWDMIEDRGRVAVKAPDWENIQSVVDAAADQYRLPRWTGQPHYAELWVEKQALAGVLEPLADEFHAVFMANKGYSSQTAMYDASKRFLKAIEREQECHVFYLGDHDPSGEDMVRDIQDRLELFCGQPVDVEKLALTWEQVKQYKPPPNPAKLADPRAQEYIARHGNKSWELDALKPEVLAKLVRDAFNAIIDRKKMDRIIRREKKDVQALKRAVKRLPDAQRMLKLLD